jgi:hypothetical protein
MNFSVPFSVIAATEKVTFFLYFISAFFVDIKAAYFIASQFA